MQCHDGYVPSSQNGTESEWEASHPFQKIVVVGMGYIGLPTATLFAVSGLEVVGLDIRAEVVDTINSGKVHIVEPDLDAMVASVVAEKRLRASLTPEAADAFIIAVGTPCRAGHVPDISAVEAAARTIAPVLQKGNLVIVESTSPVGTTERVAEILAELRPDLTFPQSAGNHADVQVAHCPERVLPGRIFTELVENDRAIGGMTPRCSQRAVALYGIVVRGECFTTTARTAELAKLTENSFRDVNIAFANELSIICDRLEIDVWELIAIANRHPRVNILQPGPGVGGHCIAVDPWFIVHSAPEEARLIRTAREVNDSKPWHVLQKIQRAADRFRHPVIACFGLAFKPDIDDLRESPAVEIVHKLAEAGTGKILAVEPHITRLDEELTELGVELVNERTALQQADIVVLLVNHRVFRTLSPHNLAEKVVVDTRGMLKAGSLSSPSSAEARRVPC